MNISAKLKYSKVPSGFNRDALWVL
jgi:hypothetical protein